jgi:hypothetical protein
MAVHGAGHAAVGTRLGLFLTCIDLSGNDGSTGYVQFRPPGQWFHAQLSRGYEMSARARRRLEAEMMTGWAGTLAESKAFPCDTAVVEHSFGELEIANSDLALLDGDLALLVTLGSYFTSGDDAATTPLLEMMRIRTLRMVEDELTWMQVERLAERLLEHETLSGSQTRSLIRSVSEGRDLARPLEGT